MSISKILEKTKLKDEKEGFRISFVGIMEVIILIAIPFTSLNIEFITLPIFLSVTFILIQIRKVGRSIIQKNRRIGQSE